jgi:S-adenosylmethionine decarboxylase proenzyme
VIASLHEWRQTAAAQQEARDVRTEGNHLLLEYRGCDAGILDDLDRIQRLMAQAALATNARIVDLLFRPFRPQGVSGVVVIEESHLSIHTWPEARYAAVDLFTCGTECVPEAAHKVLVEGLEASEHSMLKVRRGLLEAPYLELVPPDD